MCCPLHGSWEHVCIALQFQNLDVIFLLSERESHYVPVDDLELTIWSRLASNSERSTFLGLFTAKIRDIHDCLQLCKFKLLCWQNHVPSEVWVEISRLLHFCFFGVSCIPPHTLLSVVSQPSCLCVFTWPSSNKDPGHIGLDSHWWHHLNLIKPLKDLLPHDVYLSTEG